MQLIFNHKSNLTYNEIIKYEKKLRKYNVIVLPTTCYLSLFKKGKYILGSQDISEFEEKNRTGEINGEQLKSLNVEYVLIGHTERRQYNLETEKTIKNKLERAISSNIAPLYCIGEKNNIGEVNEQIDLYFNNVVKEKNYIVYEPVNNIGKKNIDIETIKRNIKYIKDYSKETYNKNIKLIYGGGVNLKNIKELSKINEIDGLILSKDALEINNIDKLYKMAN